MNALGIPAPRAFMLLSAAASLALIVLLWRLLAELLPDAPGFRTLALAAFLFHPATIRCLVRPQTDALYALCVVAALAWGRRIARPDAGRRCCAWFAVSQTAALFVKVHVLPLLLVPPAVAFLAGARGRRLLAAFAFGTLVPLAAWAALFLAFDLFGTIGHLWGWIDRLFQDWTAGRVVRLVLLAFGPLLVAALVHPRLRSGFPLALLLFVAGYAALLFVTEKPPLMRFAYPTLAPLVLLAAPGLRARFGAGRAATAVLATLLVWHVVLTAAWFTALLYVRYAGPMRDIEWWARHVVELT